MRSSLQKRGVMTAQSQKIVDDLHGRIAELEAENTRLSEALAEAEKKGAEDWQPLSVREREYLENRRRHWQEEATRQYNRAEAAEQRVAALERWRKEESVRADDAAEAWAELRRAERKAADAAFRLVMVRADRAEAELEAIKSGERSNGNCNAVGDPDDGGVCLGSLPVDGERVAGRSSDACVVFAGGDVGGGQSSTVEHLHNPPRDLSQGGQP